MQEVFAILKDVIEEGDRFIAMCVDLDLTYKITDALNYEAAMRNALDHTFGRVHVKFAATEIIMAMRQAGGHETDYLSGLEMELKTDYERDKREIEELMLHFLPHYMEDLRHGAYTLPRNTEQSLRHIFTVGAMKEYFYENMPSMANPLGLGHKKMKKFWMRMV